MKKILILLFGVIAYFTLLIAFLYAIFIAVKFFEERDLIRSHGQDYLEYKKRVPMFVPFTK